MDKIYFTLKNLTTDTITGVNGSALQTPMLVVDWVEDNLGDWWVERTVRGDLVLVTNCTELTDMYISADDGVAVYTVDAQSNLIGGRPGDRGK